MLRHHGNWGDSNERTRRRAQWMVEVQRGDADAYAKLLDDIGPVLMAFLRRRIRDRDQAEDLYQEVLLSMHRARHTYEPSRPVEPWLFAIARHIVSDQQKRDVRRRTCEVLVATPPETPVQCDGHVKPQLEQALRRLSAEQREAIALLRVEGLPLEGAARRAGTTAGALKVRAHRAYRVLRGLL
jgi:RNA polymerase sigma-70 factor (ECF subfamily)